MIPYLKEKLAGNEDKFQLVQETQIGKDAVQATLNFNRSDKNGYYFNDFTLKIKTAGDDATEIIQHIPRNKDAKFTFNGKKMGIQGFSTGGDKTHHIITHTDLFAAASSTSGVANQISWIGTPSDRGNSPGAGVAQGKGDQIGYTLWEKPGLYIENSPIFFAHKVKTPILIMNGTKDDRFNHSVEFFLALHRLGKPSWLLEYEEDGHGVQGVKSQTDWTLRLVPFFDHFLKDKPAPVWMTKGIPAKYKGLVTGLEIDEQGGREARLSDN